MNGGHHSSLRTLLISGGHIMLDTIFNQLGSRGLGRSIRVQLCRSVNDAVSRVVARFQVARPGGLPRHQPGGAVAKAMLRHKAGDAAAAGCRGRRQWWGMQLQQ